MIIYLEEWMDNYLSTTTMILDLQNLLSWATFSESGKRTISILITSFQLFLHLPPLLLYPKMSPISHLLIVALINPLYLFESLIIYLNLKKYEDNSLSEP